MIWTPWTDSSCNIRIYKPIVWSTATLGRQERVNGPTSCSTGSKLGCSFSARTHQQRKKCPNGSWLNQSILNKSMCKNKISMSSFMLSVTQRHWKWETKSIPQRLCNVLQINFVENQECIRTTRSLVHTHSINRNRLPRKLSVLIDIPVN